MTDTSARPTVVVLRSDVHGLSTADYAEALRDRLPDHEVRHARTPAAERHLVADAEVLTGATVEPSLLEEADSLRLFACVAAGVDHLPLDRLEARNVTVTNASGVHGPNVAEYVVGSVLVFTNRFRTGWHNERRREWRHYRTGELAGSTATVVGLGAIGSAVVDRFDAFDVRTIGVRRSPSSGGPADEILGVDDLHDALARSEFVVLACPLTEQTRGLLGDPELRTMPPEAVVVNVARGPVVDTDALVAALRRETVRGAVLDVTDPEPLPEDHPLWGLDNAMITPHNAGDTPYYWDRMADIVAENVRHVGETGEYDGLRNQVLP